MEFLRNPRFTFGSKTQRKEPGWFKRTCPPTKTSQKSIIITAQRIDDEKKCILNEAQHGGNKELEPRKDWNDVIERKEPMSTRETCSMLEKKPDPFKCCGIEGTGYRYAHWLSIERHQRTPGTNERRENGVRFHPVPSRSKKIVGMTSFHCKNQ